MSVGCDHDTPAFAVASKLIEFALVFPLLLMVILGIVDFGFLFQRYEVLTNAAREGARVAALLSSFPSC